MMTEQQAKMLQTLVDDVGVANVLDALAIICNAKAKVTRPLVGMAAWQWSATECGEIATMLRLKV